MSAVAIEHFEVSVLSSPRPVGKRLSLCQGVLSKETLGVPAAGTVERRQCASLSEFCKLREGLSARQALTYGTAAPICKLVPQDALRNARKGRLPVVARDRQHFRFTEGATVMMIDHDPVHGECGMAADDLHRVICAAMPELKGVTMLWAPSSGSNIWTCDGRELAGLRGSRLYWVVDNGVEVPRIGKLLEQRLALAGHARVHVTAAGNMLNRTPVDASVFQPERLDYVRATCEIGLEKRDESPRFFGPEGTETMLVTASVPALTSEERINAAIAWKAARTAAEPQATANRETWAAARAAIDAARGDVKRDDAWRADRASAYASSATRYELEKDHELQLADGTRLTVAELLAEPQKYHGARMHDPHEPDYGRDKRIAQAYLPEGRIWEASIYSHAHGGSRYALVTPDDWYAGFADDGNTAVEASDAAVAEVSTPAVKSSARPLRVLSRSQLRDMPAARWLVPGLLPEKGLAVVYGPSGAGKSFAVLDIALSLARGVPWHGRPVTQAGVLYVAAEGSSGFAGRLAAYEQHHRCRLDDDPFWLVPEAIDLLNAKDPDRVVTAAKACAAPVGLIVLDTLNRSMGGGANENDAADMTRVVNAAAAIGEGTGALVLIVHHAGKDAQRGARGHSSLRAATDAEICVRRGSDGGRILEVTKQRDGSDDLSLGFGLQPVTLEDGSSVPAVVPREITREASGGAVGGRPAPWDGAVLRSLTQLTEGSEEPSAGAEAVIQGAAESYRAEHGNLPTRWRASASRAMERLVERSVLVRAGGRVSLDHLQDLPI